jgi:hypothetical protein
MAYRRFLAGLVALAGCGHAFATPTEVRTSAAPETVFACVKQRLDTLGYKRNSLDTEELRVNATKIDLKSRRSDTQFRRVLNTLEVDVDPGADGQTSLKVVPRTFAEYTTQRGPTEVEEKSSDDVKNDAQRLVEACKS